jgi:methanogenic corrinoid protein MtbC1
MVKTGVRGISFDQCMDLLAYEDAIPDGVAIIGNIDPVEIVEMATPAEVAASVEDLVAIMGVKDNFTLSTGCALPPSTPIANVVRFIETGKAALSKLEPYSVTLAHLGDNVHRGERESVPKLVDRALEERADPLMIVNSGLMRAVRKGSARYETRQSFLPEILLMVDAFYQGFRTLEPHLAVEGDRPPQLILGTVKGDFHEIGKNLVRIILETNGVKVLDLGVNVPAEKFLEAADFHGVPVVGLSAFITSTRKQLTKIVRSFQQPDVRPVSIIVGGAAVNQQLAATIGANGYARDAVGAVKLVKHILKESKG